MVLVRNPRARRYVLRLRSDGIARVTVPRGGSPAEARRFAERNRPWLERQLQQASRNGIGPNEAHYFDARIYDLEIRLGQAVNRNRYGYANNGYNGDYGDRSRGRHWERDDDDDRD